jgi:hypothetical protein
MMRHYISTVLFLFGIIVISGCKDFSANQNFSRENVTLFIRELNLVPLLNRTIPAGSRITLAPLKKGSSIPDGLKMLIEQIVVGQLISANYKVLERDERIIDLLLKESVYTKYSVFYEEQKRLLDSIASVDINLAAHDLENEKIRSFLEKDRNPVYLAPTPFESADYLILYRVDEVKVIHQFSIGSVKRLGLARIFIRIEDPKSGQIIFSGPLEARVSKDIVEVGDEDFIDFYYVDSHNFEGSKIDLHEEGKSLLFIGAGMSGTKYSSTGGGNARFLVGQGLNAGWETLGRYRLNARYSYAL